MKLGLALSGGGIKGSAHIGVLQAFEEENIKIDYISGTSSGSIVATLYAIGYKPDEIYSMFKNYSRQINYISIWNIVKLVYGLLIKKDIIIQGLNNGKKIESLMKEFCEAKGVKNIKEIKMPLIIPSVSLHSGKKYIFSSYKTRNLYNDGKEYINDIEIEKAVRASCSYPGVFEPVKYGKDEMIDGGIKENTPWKELELVGADKVIGVTFEEYLKEDDYINIIEVLERALGILSHELSNYELAGAEELLKIKTKHISLLDSSKIDFLYAKGYNKAKEFIRKKNLKNIVEK